MLDPEITCQADNIRPELIRDLQSVVATFLPALGTSLSWDKDGVGIRRRRSRCDFFEQVLEASMVVIKRLKCFDTDGANQNRSATRRPHATERPAQDLHRKSKTVTLVTAERSKRAMRRQRLGRIACGISRNVKGPSLRQQFAGLGGQQHGPARALGRRQIDYNGRAILAREPEGDRVRAEDGLGSSPWRDPS